MKPKKNNAGDTTQSKGYDRCQTPPYAIQPLIPHLPHHITVWEPAAGEGYLANAIRPYVENVIATDILTEQNFFEYEPEDYDVIITNPPYSIKYQWLERCIDLCIYQNKAFALLVPLETLGAARAQKLLKKINTKVILMDKRTDFKIGGHGWADSSAQFPVIWLVSGNFVRGYNLQYFSLNKPTKLQLQAIDDGRLTWGEL